MHISPHWAPSCDHGFWKTWARAEKRNIANVENLEIMKNLISPISDLGFRGRCGVGCRRTPLHVRNCAVGTRSLSSKSSAACKTRSPHQQCSSWFGHSNCVSCSQPATVHVETNAAAPIRWALARNAQCEWCAPWRSNTENTLYYEYR